MNGPIRRLKVSSQSRTRRQTLRLASTRGTEYNGLFWRFGLLGRAARGLGEHDKANIIARVGNEILEIQTLKHM